MLQNRIDTERQAADAIAKARAALVLTRKFYAVLVGQVVAKPCWSIPTMATDSVTHYYNPAFIVSLPPVEVLGTQAHESEHDARHHSTRRQGRDPKDWNRACDYAINGDLMAEGFVLPKGALYREDFVGLSAEEIYRILQLEKQKQTPPPPQGGEGEKCEDGDDSDKPSDDKSEESENDSDDEKSDDESDGGDGSDDDESEDEESEDKESDDGDGEGETEAEGDDEAGDEAGDEEADGDGDGDDTGEDTDVEADAEDEDENGDGDKGDEPTSCGEDGGCGEVLDAPGDEAEVADLDAKWEVVTRQAVALAKKAGTLPGHWATEIERRKTPTQDWRAILREYIDAGARRIETWNRPNRRFAHSGFILPGNQRDGINKVVFIIDASGSMVGQHVKVANELQAALDDGAISEVVLVYIDTEVYRVDRFADGDKIEFGEIKGGGTAMLPAFRWAAENESDANLIVCLTDLYIETITPADEPACPALWCAYGDPRAIKSEGAKLPWGKVVDVDNE